MNFLDGLAETVNRAFCAALAPTVAQADLLQYVLTPGFGEQYNPFPALYAQNCPLTPPVQPQPPFSGGQCPTAYDLQVTRTRQDPGDIPRTSTVSVPLVRGKVGALGIDRPGGATRLYVSGGLEGNPDANARYNVETSGLPGQPQPIFTNFFISSIVRRDGQPDNCGNPPPDTSPPPPGYNVVNDNVTYNNTNNVSVTIPVVLAFGYATLNVDGTLSIPINANFTANPEFNANFSLNLNTGDLVPDFTDPRAPLPSPCSPPGGFVPDPALPPAPDSIPDPSPDPPATEQPTERRELLAACIVTTTLLDGNETTIFQQENPDIHVPAIGYVQFRIRVGNSSAWTSDVPVKSLRAFIPCPWDAGAIEVKGSPRFGNQFTVTPVYITQTFNPTYPPAS